MYKAIASALGIERDALKIKVKIEKNGQTKVIDVPDANSVIPGLYPKDKTFYYSRSCDYKQISFTC